MKINPLWFSVVTVVLGNLLTNLVTHYAIFQGINASEITGMAAALAYAVVGAVYVLIVAVVAWIHHKLAAVQASKAAQEATNSLVNVLKDVI